MGNKQPKGKSKSPQPQRPKKPNSSTSRDSRVEYMSEHLSQFENPRTERSHPEDKIVSMMVNIPQIGPVAISRTNWNIGQTRKQAVNELGDGLRFANRFFVYRDVGDRICFNHQIGERDFLIEKAHLNTGDIDEEDDDDCDTQQTSPVFKTPDMEKPKSKIINVSDYPDENHFSELKQKGFEVKNEIYDDSFSDNNSVSPYKETPTKHSEMYPQETPTEPSPYSNNLANRGASQSNIFLKPRSKSSALQKSKSGFLKSAASNKIFDEGLTNQADPLKGTIEHPFDFFNQKEHQNAVSNSKNSFKLLENRGGESERSKINPMMHRSGNRKNNTRNELATVFGNSRAPAGKNRAMPKTVKIGVAELAYNSRPNQQTSSRFKSVRPAYYQKKPDLANQISSMKDRYGGKKSSRDGSKSTKVMIDINSLSSKAMRDLIKKIS